jgi:hypothetical protein
MKILRKNIDQNIILNSEDTFKTDLGWQDNAEEMEKELLENIINPVQNFETVRYIHEPYTGSTGILQTDIWFKFWFTSGNTYVQDYEPTGLSVNENAQMLKQTTESFFRLEFYKTPNNDSPNRLNRRLVFAKNLSLPLGEKYFYTTLNDYIFKPVFMGSNYKNKENMYLFWFQNDSALNEETLTGNTFYMNAKFFNAEDGSIVDFVTSNLLTEVNETNDMYYKMEIDRTDYSYKMYQYSGTTGSRIGQSNNPIVFYERKN